MSSAVPVRPLPMKDPGLPPAQREAVQAALAQLKDLPGALLPVLHAVQDALGHVPPGAVPLIAHGLNLSRADVHGVISFYHHFRTAPPGRHVLHLCGEGGRSGKERLPILTGSIHEAFIECWRARRSVSADVHHRLRSGQGGFEGSADCAPLPSPVAICERDILPRHLVGSLLDHLISYHGVRLLCWRGLWHSQEARQLRLPIRR